jgi:hypothetical protein
VLTGVAVFGLVAGLLVWAPWSTPPPNTPTAITAMSSTATSMTVSWTMPKGGTTPDRFLVMRDGTQVAMVSAAQMSFTDNGLTPGSTHVYTIVAASGGLRSGESAKEKAVTLAPSPVKLGVTNATWSTMTLNWSPSPQGPTPSTYTIYNGTSPVATVPGSTTSYNFTGLTPGHGCQCSVAAHWGAATSAPSTPLAATALEPPLTGQVPVKLNTTSTPGGGSSLKVGDHWGDEWTFGPQCAGTTCHLTTQADLAAPGFSVKGFTIDLKGSGNRYTGTTTAQISTCSSVNVNNTITLTIAANSGGIQNGAWTTWSGTLQVSSPYTVEGDMYCPTQSWQFNVTPG